MNASKKILITGISGFVGTYLAQLLGGIPNYSVYGLIRDSSTLEFLQDVRSSIHWITGDILHPEEWDIWQELDTVIHCAAKVSYRRRDWESLYETNQVGTESIVNACLDSNTSLIHVSSIAAFGRHPERTQVDEHSEWVESKYNTHYAQSKMLGELEVWRGITEGLRATIVCPSVILGSHYWDRGTQQFFKSVWQGLSYYPVGSNGFVDVRDVCQAIESLLSKPVFGNRYILSGNNFTYAQVLAEIAGALGKKPPQKAVRSSWIPWLLPLAGLADRLRISKRFTPEVLMNTSMTVSYDNQLSVQELGVTYRSLDKTIEAIAHQWKENYPQNLPTLLTF